MRPGIVGVALLWLASVACSSSQTRPKQYAMTGVVVRISQSENLATIKTDKIPGWMDAMTMEYPVENKTEYLSLRKGEKITATVNVTGEGYWLTNVKESKE